MMTIELKVPDGWTPGLTLAARQLLQGSIDRGFPIVTVVRPGEMSTGNAADRASYRSRARRHRIWAAAQRQAARPGTLRARARPSRRRAIRGSAMIETSG